MFDDDCIELLTKRKKKDEDNYAHVLAREAVKKFERKAIIGIKQNK